MKGEDHDLTGSADIGAFRLIESQAKTVGRGKKRRALRPHVRLAGLFVRGPVPWPWLAAAAYLPGRALHVAVTLRLLAGMRRGGPVSLSSTRLKDAGVGRHAAYRGLRNLEQAGLVEVVRRRGRQPVVTIREL